MTDLWNELLQSMEATMALYRCMLEMSEEKKNVLVQGKPGGMEAFNRQEEALILQGNELEHRRAKATADIVNALGLSDARPSLNDLAAVAEPEVAERLQTLRREFGSVLKELSRRNEVNAKLTEQALAFVNFNLNLLTRRQVENTYAPAGAAAPPRSTQAALLDRKV
ncbi:MAG: flagellar protein FlgN [Negativicutes bacterium]